MKSGRGREFASDEHLGPDSSSDVVPDPDPPDVDAPVHVPVDELRVVLVFVDSKSPDVPARETRRLSHLPHPRLHRRVLPGVALVRPLRALLRALSLLLSDPGQDLVR